jgi:hypothetical protein
MRLHPLNWLLLWLLLLMQVVAPVAAIGEQQQMQEQR